MSKWELAGISVLAAIVVLILAALYDEDQACAARGGVLVRAVFGWECVSAKGSK